MSKIEQTKFLDYKENGKMENLCLFQKYKVQFQFTHQNYELKSNRNYSVCQS